MSHKLSLAHAVANGWLVPSWPRDYIERQQHRRSIEVRLAGLSDDQMTVYWEARKQFGIRDSLDIAEGRA